jgi:hypothetical protein
MRVKKIATASVGLVLGAAVIACIGGPSTIGKGLELSLAPEEVKITGEGLTLESCYVKRDILFTYIVGTVANDSDVEYDSVFIEFNLYDDSGALVDNAIDGIDNLEPHGKWEFEATVFEERAAKAKLKSITGRSYRK